MVALELSELQEDLDQWVNVAFQDQMDYLVFQEKEELLETLGELDQTDLKVNKGI